MKTTLLFGSLLLTCTIFSNSFAAVGSGKAPLNGSYTQMSNDVCTADSANPVPANTSTSLNGSAIYIHTFTPDISHTGATSSAAFTSWVNYLGTQGVTIPVGFFNSLADPSSPTVKLIETPIQWGSASLVGMSSGYNLPYTSFKSVNLDPGSRWSIVTSFNYAVPANNNNVKVGYIHNGYNPNSKTWRKSYIFPNLASSNITSTTPPVTSVAALYSYVQTITIGTNTYQYDCLNTSLLAK